MIERPTWNERTGELTWRDEVVLKLARHAHSERAILAAFERSGWIWLIRNPIARADVGHATQERRHAIYNLNRKQRANRDDRRLYFFSVARGLVTWCDGEWLAMFH